MGVAYSSAFGNGYKVSIQKWIIFPCRTMHLSAMGYTLTNVFLDFIMIKHHRVFSHKTETDMTQLDKVTLWDHHLYDPCWLKHQVQCMTVPKFKNWKLKFKKISIIIALKPIKYWGIKFTKLKKHKNITQRNKGRHQSLGRNTVIMD
jgi:hypothetical protein